MALTEAAKAFIPISAARTLIGPFGRRDDVVDLFLGANVVGEHNATETGRLVVTDGAVARKLVTTPDNQGDTACLNEHSFFGLLADPAHPVIKRPSAMYVGDTQGNQADPLLHRSKLSRRAATKLEKLAACRAAGVKRADRLALARPLYRRPRSRSPTGASDRFRSLREIEMFRVRVEDRT